MLRRARVALLRIASPLLSSRLFSSSFPRELGLFIAVEELLSSNPRAPRSHSRRSGEPSRLMECTGGHLHSIGSARLEMLRSLPLFSTLLSLSPSPLSWILRCETRAAISAVILVEARRDATPRGALSQRCVWRSRAVAVAVEPPPSFPSPAAAAASRTSRESESSRSRRTLLSAIYTREWPLPTPFIGRFASLAVASSTLAALIISSPIY